VLYSARKIMKKSALLLAIMFLNGCSSEVDKCVAAFMKRFDNESPKSTKAERDEEEAKMRYACLKVASKS
jgi:PBP1b-binding outer membrane lipoprotein LpoB